MCFLRWDFVPLCKLWYSKLKIVGTFIFFRWVEGKKSSDRLISIWDNVCKTVNYWQKLTKSKTYSNLKSYVFDNFTVAKLQYFSYIASKVEPYLEMYQTDNLVIPYMYFNLKTMLKDLLEIIVEPEVIQKCKTGKQLIEINQS